MLEHCFRQISIAFAVAAAGTLLAGGFAPAALAAAPLASAHWIGTWGTAPEPPRPAVGRFPGTQSFSDQTIRQLVRISAGGTHLRIHFTNEYGTHPLHIGAASVALVGPGGAPEPGTERTLSFAGKPDAWIPAGAPYVSDAIDLAVKPLATVAISIYFPDQTDPCTCHAVGLQTAYVSGPGNFVGKPFDAAQMIQSRAFISGVDVETTSSGGTIVALGDSITDGFGSTPNANSRWPDLLADRLVAQHGRQAWGVVDMGISGNRVLADGVGEGALHRFDRDVLSVPAVKYVIFFEGVNDLINSYAQSSGLSPKDPGKDSGTSAPKATAAALIAGYRQLIERAHTHGIKVIGVTLTPYAGATLGRRADLYSPEGEAQREAINRWIRASGAFDGVLDFDAVWRDPADPTRIISSLQHGDHLHGNDAGYQALVRSINPALFR
jgi:lysophospholipase L1-like esterase